MADYQPTEADKVLLDYAQTAQRRADPWEEFEVHAVDEGWIPCNEGRNPVSVPKWKYRRKPRTVTLSYQGREWELPVMYESQQYFGGDKSAVLFFDDTEKRDQWLAALREIAGGENG